MIVFIDRVLLYILIYYLIRLMVGENLIVEFILMFSFLVYYFLLSSRFF